MVLILYLKNVFEPSYSDSKFMVWNHKYACTNLILVLLQYNIWNNCSVTGIGDTKMNKSESPTLRSIHYLEGVIC